MPQRPLGRDVWWGASGLRLDRVTAESRLGRRLAGRDQIVGTGPRQLARRHGITVRPRVAAVAERSISFADRTHAEYDAVVWATGFTMDDSWIDVPDATDERGRLRQTRGHPLAGALHARPDLAAHPRLGAAGLGRCGRGLPRRADHGTRPMSGRES